MQRLFIMRHAIAEDRGDFAKTGRPDDDRPLTKEGRERLDKVAKKLAHLDLEIGTLVQSPLTRSQQTAEGLAAHLGKVKILTLESLRPGSDFGQLIKDLNRIDGGNSLIIGHEDHLSQFTMHLLTGGEHIDFMQFKKAGLACLSYEGKIHSKKMHLEWLLTPKICLDL